MLNTRALGSEMPVADDYYAQSALKIAPSPLARKSTTATCGHQQSNAQLLPLDTDNNNFT